MGKKRGSAESPSSSVDHAKRHCGLFDGILKDEGKLGTLTRLKLSQHRDVILNSPYTTAKAKKLRKNLSKVRMAQLADEDKENADELNLKHWVDVHSKQLKQIKDLSAQLERIVAEKPCPSEFWETHCNRTTGEGALFLGKKSKLNQFGDMCQDPTNVKFNVKKEDDLKAFWDGMVYPSVEDFITRSKWLISAGEKQWPDSEKQNDPKQPKAQVFKAKTKPNISKEKDPKEQEKLAAQKKKAEERRAEMRKKMLEMKRQRMQQEQS